MTGNVFPLGVSRDREVLMQSPDLPELFLNGDVPDPASGWVLYLIDQTTRALGMDTGAGAVDPADISNADYRASLFWIIRQSTIDPIITADIHEARALRVAGQRADHISQYTLADLEAMMWAAWGGSARYADFFRHGQSQGAPVADVSHDEGQPHERGDGTEHSNNPTVDTLVREPSGEPVGALDGEQAQRADREDVPASMGADAALG